MSHHQKEYVDRRGVHVVIGHYIGDTSSDKHPPNLTDGKYTVLSLYFHKIKQLLRKGKIIGIVLTRL